MPYCSAWARERCFSTRSDHSRPCGRTNPSGIWFLPTAECRRALLPYAFWREFVDMENVVAIKMAPFNRYQTIDVVRAVAESGREIALYTGNDDSILVDLADRV